MFRRSMLMVLGIVLMLVVSACGQQASTAGSPSATAQGSSTGGDAMAGMDHGGMAMDETATAMPMDHGGMAMDATSTATDAPFDAQFIDGMIVHHTGAIDMAKQALTESERPEIKQLAENIISSQQQEVEQMTNWRKEWYPDLPPTGGMAMSMGDMEISADQSQPFDQRFITAMIGHHNGAIAMAKEAQTKAEHSEIKELAGEIIKAQEAEVAQMQQWSSEWFGS
jgi:uncharacterized protein (DUF305 family)